VRLVIRTSRAKNGALFASVNGDKFEGVAGVELSRPDADEYRPKWGLYRKAIVKASLGDDYVEHREIHAQKLPAEFAVAEAKPALIMTPDDNAALEREARGRVRKSSPEETLAWLQKLPESESPSFTLGSIAALWAESDPAAAMAWAEKFPRREVRLDATARIFSRWADRDTDAALAWLQRHAPDAELDQIAWLLATDTTYRYVNRHFALEGAALIQEPALRAAAFEHVVLIWARDQPGDAIAFVKKCPALTAAQREKILDKLPTRRAL